MKQKQILISSLLLLCALPLSAVNLAVSPKVGGSTSISMTDVQTLTFAGGNLVVNKKDATTNSFALAGMGYINFSDITTLVSSLQAKPQLTTYPNPVKVVLNIEFQFANNQFSQLEIIGIDGKVVLRTLISGPAINLSVSSLPVGLYLLRVQNGNTTQITKFIKQ